jgi:hypothetical protein
MEISFETGIRARHHFLQLAEKVKPIIAQKFWLGKSKAF